MYKYAIPNTSRCGHFWCDKNTSATIKCRRCDKDIGQPYVKKDATYPYNDYGGTAEEKAELNSQITGQCMILGHGGGTQEKLDKPENQIGLRWRKCINKKGKNQIVNNALAAVLVRRRTITCDEYEKFKLFDIAIGDYIEVKGIAYEPVANNENEQAKKQEHEKHVYTCLNCYNTKIADVQRNEPCRTNRYKDITLDPRRNIEVINDTFERGIVLNGVPFRTQWSRDRLSKLQGTESYYKHQLHRDVFSNVHLLSEFFVDKINTDKRAAHMTTLFKEMPHSEVGLELAHAANMNRYEFTGNKLPFIYTAYANGDTSKKWTDTEVDDIDPQTSIFNEVNINGNLYSSHGTYYIYGIFIKCVKIQLQMLEVCTVKDNKQIRRPVWSIDFADFKKCIQETEVVVDYKQLIPNVHYSEILGGVFLLRSEKYKHSNIYLKALQNHLKTGTATYLVPQLNQVNVIPTMTKDTYLLYLNNVYTWNDFRSHGLMQDMFDSIESTLRQHKSQFMDDFRFVYFCTKRNNPGMTISAQRAGYTSILIDDENMYYPLVWFKYHPKET